MQWKEVQPLQANASRITEHPVFPGRQGPAARRIRTDEDVRDVIAMMRLNYDRITARAAVC